MTPRSNSKKIFRKSKYRYHSFALHTAWSCFGAWKTTFWAWIFEFCKPQFCSYNQTLEAEASVSPYLKSLGPDFWYCHYFLKKLNFRIHINRILQKCLRIACKACEILKKLFFWSKNSNLPDSFHMLHNDVESVLKQYFFLPHAVRYLPHELIN